MIWWQWWQTALTSHFTMTEFKAEYIQIQGVKQLTKALGSKHLVIPTPCFQSCSIAHLLPPPHDTGYLPRSSSITTHWAFTVGGLSNACTSKTHTLARMYCSCICAYVQGQLRLFVHIQNHVSDSKCVWCDVWCLWVWVCMCNVMCVMWCDVCVCTCRGGPHLPAPLSQLHVQ